MLCFCHVYLSIYFTLPNAVWDTTQVLLAGLHKSCLSGDSSRLRRSQKGLCVVFVPGFQPGTNTTHKQKQLACELLGCRWITFAKPCPSAEEERIFLKKRSWPLFEENPLFFCLKISGEGRDKQVGEGHFGILFLYPKAYATAGKRLR